VGKKEHFYTVGRNEINYNHYGKQCEGLSKTKIEVPCDLVIALLGIYLKECAPGYDRITCTPIFIATLFTIQLL
jgi:hypothetical protein